MAAPLSDLELQAESLKAAEHYMKEKVKTIDLQERTAIMNASAKCFFMGARWAEIRQHQPAVNADTPKG